MEKSRKMLTGIVALAGLANAGCSDAQIDSAVDSAIDGVGTGLLYIALDGLFSCRNDDTERWEEAKREDKIRELYEPLFGEEMAGKWYPGTKEFKTRAEIREEFRRVEDYWDKRIKYHEEREKRLSK